MTCKASKSSAGSSGKKACGASGIRGIRKQYLKSRPSCRVTFRLPKEAAPGAQKVSIVGDFNNWDKGATVMKRLKSGDFSITMELETGREYCYRYLIDATRWENDWWADRYRPNPYGSDDSVVVI
ncbi:MAG: glycoside hydrolase [Nitrospirae bacterium]|nr:glycoside hydrolase [Nitrospirota bacterium]